MNDKQKILIVDDKKENLIALRQVLSEVDAEVVAAISGNQALAATLDHQFSLAILDVQMPQMSGYELAEYLREDQNTKHIPIIFLTAHSLDEQSVFQGYASGGIDYIVKPYDPEIMRGKARLFLEMDHSRRQIQHHRDHLEAMVAERTLALREEVRERKQAQQRAEHINSILRSIRRINQLIVRAREPEALVQEACKQLVETRGYSLAWIVLGHPGAENEFTAMASREGQSLEVDPSAFQGRWPACHAQAQTQAGGIVSLRPQQECGGCPVQGFCNPGLALVTLLKRGEKVMGLLGVALGNGAPVDDEERSLLLELAGDIAFALHDISIERQHDLFAEIVANSQEAMSLVDRRYHYLKVNPSYQRLVNRDEEQIEGHHVAEVLGEEYFNQAIKGQLDRCFAGETVRFETWRTVKSGERRLLEALYSPCLDPEKNTYATAVAIRDITEQRRTEEAFLAESRRAQQYFDIAGVMMVVIDQEGIVVRINRRGCEILGYGEDEILGKSWFDNFLTPETREQTLPVVQALLRDDSDQAPYYENTVLTRDGRKRLIAWHNTIIRDETGKIVGQLSSGEDVTDLRATEAALQNSAEFLLETGRMARVGGWSVNLEDMRVEWTEVTREIHEVPPDFQPTHDAAIAFYHEKDRPKLMDAIDAALNRGEPFDLELRLVSANDKPLWVHTRCRPVTEGGKVVKLVGTFQDITERLRLSKERSHLEEQMRQAQKMESIGRLAGGVAHDFNNMLSIITGYAEIAMDEVDEHDPLRKNLEQILDAAMRSRDLTRQLLAFARRQTVSPRVIDLNEVLSKSQNMLGRLIGEDIDLRLMPCEDIWPIKIDPAQIDQIIANLAVNARDAISGVGSVIIETNNLKLDEGFCISHIGLQPGDYVLLSFSDTGVGMDREIRDKVFEPFFTTKQAGKGTGLGLSTVYGIVRQADGLIDVYSEPGHGTTFKIYLPRTSQGPMEEIVEEGEADLNGNETVMVVEDEVQILGLCRQLLSRAGYQVISASQPGEALLLAEQHDGDIHLLLTDVVMPSMNGKELKERLEKIKPGLKVLYMSGYTANIIAHRGVLTEGVEFLQKPFATRDLSIKVRRLLDRSQ